MTRLLLAAAGVAALLLPLTSAARVWNDHPQIQQPDRIQPGSREWSWDGNDALKVGVPAELHYTAAGAPRIVITGPEELLAHVREGAGSIWLEDGWHGSGGDRLVINVTGVRVHDVALAGAGDASLAGLDLDHLHLSVAGSYAVKADGHAEDVDLSLAGSSHIDLGQVAARRANIRIAGSAQVWLSPHDDANVSIAGSGHVRMAARPLNLREKITGSGRVDVSDRP